MKKNKNHDCLIDRRYEGEFFYRRKAPMHVCTECNFTAKRNIEDCPNCHSKDTMKSAGFNSRIPRKSASKKKWKDYWNKYFGKKSCTCDR